MSKTSTAEGSKIINDFLSNVSQILKQIEETYGLVKKNESGYVVVDKFLKEYIKRERLFFLILF